MTGMELKQVVLRRETKAKRESTEDLLSQLPALPVECGSQSAETWEEMLGEPYVGIGCEGVTADAV